MGSKSRGSSGSDRSDSQASSRSVGKGRYTNAPPLTPSSAHRPGDGAAEIEVQVGDVTLVMRRDELDRTDKYGYRSAPAYGAVSPRDDPDPESPPDGAAASTPVMDLLVDDPIPAWGPWRSESFSSAAGYHRSESRLPED